MTFSEWIGAPVNWVFLVIAVPLLVAAFRVVTSRNIVHAALYLVGVLGATAGLFLLLSAEFVALVLILVYLGAIIVLFLFGIMITRAPTGRDEALDNERKLPAAVLAIAVFGLLTYGSLMAFSSDVVAEAGIVTDTALLGQSLMGRFVIPFEVVSFILLAALIGGITVARRDLTPLEEEQRRSV